MSLCSTISPCKRRGPCGRWIAVLAILGGLHGGSASAQLLVPPGVQGGSSVQRVDAGQPVAPPDRRPVPVRTALGRRGTESAGRPLPYQILSTPDVEYDLEVVERRSQLMITRDGVVRTAIADSAVIDVVQYSPTEIAVIGLARGATTLTLWFEGTRDPLIYLVNVIPDPSIEDQRRIDYGRLERKIADIFPNSKVHLVPLSRKIVVMGQARDGEEAARILEIVRGEYINQFGSLYGPGAGLGVGAAVGVAAVGVGGAFDPNAVDVAGGGVGIGALSSFIVNMLEVPGENQVQLRVRIAELNRQQLRQMGVNWAALFNNGQTFVGSTLGGGVGTLTGIFENGEISVLLNWLASNGTVKILSEPTMTVMSGHSASFLSGGEFAVPTIVGVGGAQGTSTTFRGFGTSLIATPTIIDRDLVRMRIVPEFSQINNANAVNGIPGVDARRVQTTVQLREGQTLAIAGLIARVQSTEVTRVPFLGEIPFIGPAIFNSKRATEDETELLILVSPEIVRPMEADEVPPVPGFEVTHPHDKELYFHARTEGAPDLQQYQLAPYGRGAGYGIPVGYKLFGPTPASPEYPPQPTGHYRGSGDYPQGSAGGEYVPVGPGHSQSPYPGQGYAPPMEQGRPHSGQSYPSTPYPGESYGPSQPLPAPQPGGVPHGSRYAPTEAPQPSMPRQPAPDRPNSLPPLPGRYESNGPDMQGPSARRPGAYRTSQTWPNESSTRGTAPDDRVVPANYPTETTRRSTSTQYDPRYAR